MMILVSGSGAGILSMGMLVSLASFGCAAGGGEQQPEPEAAIQEAATVAAGWDGVDEVEFLPNQVFPTEGIVAGGQPSLEQLEALRDAGYTTVINLRTEGEDGTGAAEVEGLGMAYVPLPIAGADGLTRDEAIAFAAALDEAEGPIAVHCGSGNRVGALFARKCFYVDGMNSEEALEFGRETGMTRLESAVREHLAAAEGGES